MKKLILSVTAVLLLLAGCSAPNDERVNQLSEGDQMYNKYRTVIDALEAKDYDTAISEISKMKGEEQSSALTEQYNNITSIGYFEDYDVYTTATYGTSYLIEYDEKTGNCLFNYHDPFTDNGDVRCEFSKDVFAHVLDTLMTSQLQEVTAPTDEHGKLVEKRVQDCIKIGDGYEYTCFEILDNKDEVIKCFTDLLDWAKE